MALAGELIGKPPPPLPPPDPHPCVVCCVYHCKGSGEERVLHEAEGRRLRGKETQRGGDHPSVHCIRSLPNLQTGENANISAIPVHAIRPQERHEQNAPEELSVSPEQVLPAPMLGCLQVAGSHSERDTIPQLEDPGFKLLCW
ncbi:unnamed protein product [Pleuronectes platessa]|uniref:Uncharacterized protein n=1 Tax=Pleuronectes platessa TaxID=8262 RepID=A0A9N7UQG5_PLEPL|nr:unnamed protein product [Pleuronectes platessa]